MALPVTISGIDTAVACAGPFKSSGGNFYFFGRSSSSAPTLVAMKATDPTSSFSSVDTEVMGGGGSILAIAAFQDGDTIHIAVALESSVTTNTEYCYTTFDCSTDTIAADETIQATLDTRTSGGAHQRACSIVKRSDGSVVVLYNGARVASMGNSYSRIVYARRASGGGWTTNVAVDAGGTTDYLSAEAILGASDRAQFVFCSDGTSTFQRALTSANSLQTAGTFGNTIVITSAATQGVSYDDSGTQRVAVVGPQKRVGYFNDGNTPTLNTSGVIDTNGSVFRLFKDGVDIWALYRSSADSDLYAAKSTDDGATFATAVNVFTATVGATETNLSVDGNIYQRGSDFVIPYIVNDNGTLKYNEYVVRSVSNNKTLAADAGSYTITGTAATLKVARKVVADAGAYSVTGTAATLKHGWKISAGTGSYAVTGVAASLLHAKKLSGGAGSYALTGTDATLRKGLTLPVDPGSYTFAGIAASLLHNWKLTAGAGSYAVTGTAASLLHNWVLTAGAGSYQFTGTNATLRRNLPLIAGAGSYSISGQAASLLRGWKLSAGAGSYAITGTNAALLKGQTLAAGAGSYSVTGTAASLLHGWTLSAGVGSYQITGTNATLTRDLPLIAGAGSYAISGQAASLLHAWKLPAGAGAYTVSGTAASLLHGWKLTAQAGAYAFTGTDAALITGANKILPADAGSYAVNGTNASLLHNKRLAADAGSYNVNGTAANVLHGWKIVAGNDNYAVAGQAASLLHNRKLAAGAGGYVITGDDATLIVGAAGVTITRGGLDHIECGFSAAAGGVPQTLHTIDRGIAA